MFCPSLFCNNGSDMIMMATMVTKMMMVMTKVTKMMMMMMMMMVMMNIREEQNTRANIKSLMMIL